MIHPFPGKKNSWENMPPLVVLSLGLWSPDSSCWSPASWSWMGLMAVGKLSLKARGGWF